MLTAGRAFLLAGHSYRAGEAIPEAVWLGVPEQNRRAMVRARFVRAPDLTPSKLEQRARASASPVASLTAPEASPVAARAPVAVPKSCKVCGAVFPSAGALGGHMRGHAKRGEV